MKNPSIKIIDYRIVLWRIIQSIDDKLRVNIEQSKSLPKNLIGSFFARREKKRLESEFDSLMRERREINSKLNETLHSKEDDLLSFFQFEFIKKYLVYLDYK